MKDIGVEESFVGWVSKDGLLEVVGVADEVGKYSRKLYKVVCKICSADTELFPDGYFVTYKHTLKDGSKPCGCAKYPKWSEYNYGVKLKRLTEGKNFIVHGFIEKFKGKNTRLSCECLLDGYKWAPKLKQILTMGQGCPKCHGNAKPTEQEALDKCKSICEIEGYEPIGFVDGYKNKASLFEYKCQKHGKQTVGYQPFVNQGTRCPSCAKYGYTSSKCGSFYIVKWTNIEQSFIKFGITNRDVRVRLEEQARNTDYTYEIIFQNKWKDGNIALNLENSIKASKLSIIGVINKCDFEDGYTETIKTQDIGILLDYVRNYLTNNNGG